MLFIIVNIILYIKTPEPQEVRRGVQRRVDAHGRHEHAHLVPACQQVRGRFRREPANVASHIRCSRQTPVQNHAWCAVQVGPRRVHIARPRMGGRNLAARARCPGTVMAKKRFFGCVSRSVCSCAMFHLINIICVIRVRISQFTSRK